VPNLVTTTPGSIVDTAAAGSSYGRLNTSFAAFPNSWRVGDSYAVHFNGVVSNNTQFAIEFSNGAATAGGLLGLRILIVNATADQVTVSSFGGSASQLFTGSFGGAPGVGTAQHIVADLTFSIVGATSASVSGSISDDLGSLWSGPNSTITLGTTPSVLYSGVNLNTSGGASGITTLNWVLTPVPEPGTVVLFAGMGVAALAFGRRVRKS
jgi:hypothetical protein